jgi:hypothetical protein
VTGRYISTGYLVYAKDEALLAVPMDMETHSAPPGERRRVASAVGERPLAAAHGAGAFGAPEAARIVPEDDLARGT